jgi:hypothetical protein
VNRNILPHNALRILSADDCSRRSLPATTRVHRTARVVAARDERLLATHVGRAESLRAARNLLRGSRPRSRPRHRRDADHRQSRNPRVLALKQGSIAHRRRAIAHRPNTDLSREEWPVRDKKNFFPRRDFLAKIVAKDWLRLPTGRLASRSCVLHAAKSRGSLPIGFGHPWPIILPTKCLSGRSTLAILERFPREMESGQFFSLLNKFNQISTFCFVGFPRSLVLAQSVGTKG